MMGSLPALVFKSFSSNELFVNSLPNDKFLDCSRFKAFAVNKMNGTQTMISASDRVQCRKHCEKRRKCCLPAFFSFTHNAFKGPRGH